MGSIQKFIPLLLALKVGNNFIISLQKKEINLILKHTDISADPCVIPRNLLVKIDFIVLSGRFGCQ